MQQETARLARLRARTIEALFGNCMARSVPGRAKEPRPGGEHFFYLRNKRGFIMV